MKKRAEYRPAGEPVNPSPKAIGKTPSFADGWQRGAAQQSPTAHAIRFKPSRFTDERRHFPDPNLACQAVTDDFADDSGDLPQTHEKRPISPYRQTTTLVEAASDHAAIYADIESL